MNEKENKNRRDLYLKIRVSREELDAIDRKFRNSGMKSRSEFVRAMIFEGYIVQFKKNTEYNQADKKSRELSEATRTIEEYLRHEQSRGQQQKRKRNDLE